MLIETKTIFMNTLPSDKFLSKLKDEEIYYEKWSSEFGFEIRVCIDENWNRFKRILRKYFDFNEKDKKILKKKNVDYFIFYS